MSFTSNKNFEMKEKASKAKTSPDYWIYGLHAVQAAIKNPLRRIKRALASDADVIAKMPHGPSWTITSKSEFQKILGAHTVHQGVAILTSPLPTVTLEDIFVKAATNNTCSLAFLDQVTDPHNVGAILRSAAAFQIDAVVITAQHAPQNYSVIAKTASGALEITPLIAITNLARSLEQVKKQGFWCIGLDGKGENTLDSLSKFEKVAFILGAEGAGLRKLTREHCDLLVKIKTGTTFSSLNVSNAAAITFHSLTMPTSPFITPK